MSTIQMLDVVALTADVPEHKLQAGQVGTIVEMLSPDIFEVEFSDDQGRSYAELALPGSKLLVLRYKGQDAA